MSNTESDVLLEVASQQLYVLLSGRWFESPSTKGPWEFVRADRLPASFSEIPADSDRGHLLTWVAGTQMANDAILDAAIPQTASVRREATLDVTYDGEPRFEPIEGTSLQYAVNSEFQVIRSGEQYYCVHEGIWYVADSPQATFWVATEVPEEIQQIPASSPLYNTKFVHIYDTTPEVVYVGYYPGYTYSYVYYGTVVYGTGWYYRPYYGRYYYHPRPVTWGHHVRWNPWYGWSYGFAYHTGRYTFGLGRAYRRGRWGPAGYRHYRRGYARGWHRGYHAGRRSGYNAGRRNTARNLYHGGGNKGRVASAHRREGTRATGVAAGRQNDVFADRNGNVHRRQQDGNWQSRGSGGWQDRSAGAGGGGVERGSDFGRGGSRESRPSTGRPQPSAGSRPSQSGGRSLDRDYQARQRGAQRSRSAPSGARRGGGGGGQRGGGGGRRR
jgi:hypothetical protein